ncbi:MAG: hypothetical protein AAFS10_02750 [Myxococcota bacterium]
MNTHQTLLQILLFALLTLVVGALGACSSEVGDACVTSQECPTGAICDTTAPDGYCTITPCEPNSCPQESVCIEFENELTYCMARCVIEDDCRDGYTCRSDAGPVKYCYVADN